MRGVEMGHKKDADRAGGGEGDQTAPSILVVGDWVIDEYWLLSRHYSDRSSHTGFEHHRIANRVGAHFRELCGAGHVARVLANLSRNPSTDGGSETVDVRRGPAPIITGLGRWHEADEDLIRHLVHSGHLGADDECSAGLYQESFTIQRCGTEPDHPRLHRIRLSAGDVHTSRVIRTYQMAGGVMEQLGRIDFEPDPRRAPSPSMPDDGPFVLDRPAVKAVKESTHIVLHDLNKGVVTRALIEQLAEHAVDATWWIRAKAIDPDWLDAIDGERLALMVVGPEVVASANPLNGWINGSELSQDALAYLGRMPGRNALVLTEGGQAIGRFGEVTAGEAAVHGVPQLTWATTEEHPQPEEQVGWASAVMASLVFEAAVGDQDHVLTEQMLRRSLDHANHHVDLPWAIRSDASLRGRPQATIKSGQQRMDWAQERWQEAYEGYGIVGGERNRPELHLWRATQQVPGYVACIEHKQRLLIELTRTVRSFVQHTPTKPIGIHLQADPGAGKTSLAKALADAFDLSLVPVDLTQMLHRESLLDLFDEIATRQARDPKKRILAFIDEINASLDGSPAYSSFLSPLEEGTYARSGRIFSIAPCIFLFAGTNVRRNDDRVEKLSDFESRITMTVRIDNASLKKEYSADFDKQARLETIYLGAHMIRSQFPDVTHIDAQLLRWLHDLPVDEPIARLLRRTIAGLKDVQYGVLGVGNLPDLEPIWGAGAPTVPQASNTPNPVHIIHQPVASDRD